MTPKGQVTAGNGLYACARAHARGFLVPAVTRYPADGWEGQPR